MCWTDCEKCEIESDSSSCLLVPDAIKEPKVTLKGNNAIRVECSPLKEKEWRGEKIIYHASIPNSHPEKTHEDCSFEFDDLSYSMDYVVLVGVTNPSHPTYPGTCRTLINGISCVFRSLPPMDVIKGLRQKSKLRPAVCILHSSFRAHTWSHLRENSTFFWTL